MPDNVPQKACAEQAAPQPPAEQVTHLPEAPLAAAPRDAETSRQPAANASSPSVSGRLARLLERKLSRTLSWL
jgi:hypothetical protein